MRMTYKKPLWFYFIFIMMFNSIGSMASDLYLPSLPALEHVFHVPMSLMQLSLTIFIIGFACARLSIATLSDAYGRKRPLMFSLVVCCIGSLICMWSHSITSFLIGRLVQGFGAGGSNILARVILRDMVGKDQLAKYSSFYSMAGITLMASAPLLGGYIQAYFSWQLSFFIIGLYALGSFIAASFVMPESNQHRHPVSPGIDWTHLKRLSY